MQVVDLYVQSVVYHSELVAAHWLKHSESRKDVPFVVHSTVHTGHQNLVVQISPKASKL